MSGTTSNAPEQVTITPKKGLRVICPESGRPLLSSGEQREMSTFWARRSRDGDVQIKRKAAKR